jgi:hypothetical protein
MAEFQWKFQRRSGTATLGGTLEVTQSTGKKSAIVQDITGFYVDGAMLLDELIISHHAPLETKTQVIRILASTNEPGFNALVDALAAAKPSADLRSLPRSEALKKLGVADARKVAMILVPSLVLEIALLVALPSLLYGLDHGEDRVSAAEIGTRELTSRNLVLTGEAGIDNYSFATKTTRGVKKTLYAFFPIRAPGAAKDAPVPVMLRVSGGIDQLPAGGEWKCTVHDALWDGFSDEHSKWFREDKINVTDDTKLCDLDRTPRVELESFISVVIVAVPASLLLGVLMWFNARPRKKKAVARPLS